jgi:hypothetical protein
MLAKISLTAAFLLMVAPPMACASSRQLTGHAPVSHRAIERPVGIVVAQDNDANAAASNEDKDNDNDNSDDNDNDNDNQNDSSQMDQNGAVGENQPIPPTVLGQPDGAENDSGNSMQTPQFGQPMNPYQ